METNAMHFNAAEEPKKKGISGSTLKLVAIFTMLIDHTAATILDKTLMKRGLLDLDYSNTQAVIHFYADNGLLFAVDSIMRLIGRLAFPIFCFLLVEGMIHTHNKLKYAIRLAIFALVSEIPFDLAFHSNPFYFEYQNVFFTLLIGLLVMIGFDFIVNNLKDKKWLPAFAAVGAVAVGYLMTRVIRGILQFLNSFSEGMRSDSVISMNVEMFYLLLAVFSIIALIIYILLCKAKSLQKASILFADLAVLIAGMLLADRFKTDYSGFGVLTIAIMYGLRKSHFKSMLGGCITLTVMTFSEFTSFFDLILIRFYNGKRGLNLKYVFYLFYPVHLSLLYLICYFMKIA